VHVILNFLLKQLTRDTAFTFYSRRLKEVAPVALGRKAADGIRVKIKENKLGL
jgi:hypothetical protein